MGIRGKGSMSVEGEEDGIDVGSSENHSLPSVDGIKKGTRFFLERSLWVIRNVRNYLASAIIRNRQRLSRFSAI